MTFFSLQSNAQVSNLKVNGSSSPFTMTSGDNLSWSYNLTTGGTSIGEVWVDINTNQTIDPGTDIRMFYFTIIDGDSNGVNGPGDIDGAANGVISVGPFALGLAPAAYIMKFTENNVGQTITGTVNHLASVSYTISGKVTSLVGLSAGNVIVDLNRSEKIPDDMFWNSITDVNGDFTIEINADTAGPWVLEISSDQNPFPSAIITPESYEFFISANITGKNFIVTKADAKVAGTLKFENGSPAIGSHISIFDLNSEGTQGSFRHQTSISSDGSFQIGIPLSELNGQRWVLESDLHQSDTTENYMDARTEFSIINQNDSLYYDLIFYQVDATITGKVSFGGNSTNISQITIIAMTNTAQSVAHNDAATGNFTLRVSSKISSYEVFGINLPQGYDQINLHNIAPGSTDVNLNYTITDVKERSSGIPESFSLSQNYPNPFNPSTIINYDIPKVSYVTLTIFNVLGQEITKLVNGEQAAGKYSVDFNAAGLSSGIYFYKIQAGDFVGFKKMILMK